MPHLNNFKKSILSSKAIQIYKCMNEEKIFHHGVNFINLHPFSDSHLHNLCEVNRNNNKMKEIFPLAILWFSPLCIHPEFNFSSCRYICYMTQLYTHTQFFKAVITLNVPHMSVQQLCNNPFYNQGALGYKM